MDTFENKGRLIEFKKTSADDCIQLTVLKSKFNRLATRLNRLWPTLSEDEKKEGYAKLKATEELIDAYRSS